MRVLLIEDDPALGVFYARALQRAGYEVVLKDRGDDGLQIASSQRFEIIVLDWFLPGLDGLSIVRTLRSQGFEGRVLMLSGSGSEADATAMEAGADAFLGKPCGLDELTNSVARLTSRALTRNLSAHAA